MGRMLDKPKYMYGVHLEPVTVMHGDGQQTTWADSYTKLMVFNLPRYEKVLYMDNDNMVLQVFDSPFSHYNLCNGLTFRSAAHRRTFYPISSRRPRCTSKSILGRSINLLVALYALASLKHILRKSESPLTKQRKREVRHGHHKHRLWILMHGLAA
jgi:hypothetical protein